MIEFGMQGTQTGIDLFESGHRHFTGELFGSKSETHPIIMTMN